MGCSLGEASLVEQDGAEIEVAARHPVFVLEACLERERLADRLLGPVEIMRLAIEQPEIGGGDGGDGDLALMLGDGETLEQHLLGVREAPETLEQETEIGVELGETELIVVLGAQHLRLGVIGERAVEVARLHLRACQRHQRIDQSPRFIDCCEDAFRVLELLDRRVQPSAPDIEDAGEHVDEAEDVFPPSLGEAAAPRRSALRHWECRRA